MLSIMQDHTKNETLGKVAKDVGSSSKTTKNEYQNYKLLGYAQNILIEYNIPNTKDNVHRTRLCHAARAYQAESITLKLSENSDDSRASLSGVQTCGSVWSCPVCSPRIATARADEIKQALNYARHNNLIPIMMTLTARHHSQMSLAQFKTQFKAAWRKFTQSRKYRAFKENYGMQHAIKATEITYGKHGWHYHYHVLIFCDAVSVLDGIEYQDIAENWINKLESVKLSGIEDYAFNIVADHTVGEKYMTKLGLVRDESQPAKTDTSYELTSTANKTGSGLSQWSILKKAARGDEEMAALFAEFSREMQGEYWLYWSNGFKDLVGVNDVEDKDLSQDDTENNDIVMTDWLEISDENYAYVRKLKAYGELLELAALTRDKDTILSWLELCKGRTDLVIQAKIDRLWKDWHDNGYALRVNMKAQNESRRKRKTEIDRQWLYARELELTKKRDHIKRQLLALGEKI